MSGLYERSRAFARMSQSSMLILALLLALLWYWAPSGMMDPGEEALWRRIRAGQGMLAAWRDRSGILWLGSHAADSVPERFPRFGRHIHPEGSSIPGPGFVGIAAPAHQ